MLPAQADGPTFFHEVDLMFNLPCCCKGQFHESSVAILCCQCRDAALCQAIAVSLCPKEDGIENQV